MIALSPHSTAIVLKEHKEKQEATRAMLAVSLRADDLVFRDLNGKPLPAETITRAWIKLVGRIGLNGIRLHDARHTHTSLTLKQGVHPKVVQERLGHAGIAITLDI
jgi:integrase